MWTMETKTRVALAHLSDTHLERRQYPVNSPATGRNQREQDNLRAFVQVCEDIRAWDPPLVIHAGDVADKPVVSYRTQRQVQKMAEDLTIRPDGSRRFLVVISGNHDMPRDPREPCYLEPALRPLDSVAVVTNAYEQIDLGVYAARNEAPAELANVVVHALPHDQLKRDDWDEITPVPGRINILTSHGVVGGSELYKQSLGREYAIPIDVLTRGWDYVALGHWHKRGPIAVGGFSEETTPIWYAGSTENCGFSDLRPEDPGRGYLQVHVAKGEVPTVHEVDLEIRAMFRLPSVDAAGMTYTQLTEALKANVAANTVSGAVVDQTVLNVNKDTWSLVDVGAVKRVAGEALWFQLTPKFLKPMPVSGGPDEEGEKLGDIGHSLQVVAEEFFPKKAERTRVVSAARDYLGTAFSQSPVEEVSQG